MNTKTIRNPLLEDEREDTMNNVADVLTFLGVSIVALGETGPSPVVASGMAHVLNCCTHALKGGEL